MYQEREQVYDYVCILACFRLRVFGKRSQSVDGVYDEVLLQGEVGETH